VEKTVTALMTAKATALGSAINAVAQTATVVLAMA
jgi:hypothetical protein